jgi:hypothetical protein
MSKDHPSADEILEARDLKQLLHDEYGFPDPKVDNLQDNILMAECLRIVSAVWNFNVTHGLSEVEEFKDWTLKERQGLLWESLSLEAKAHFYVDTNHLFEELVNATAHILARDILHMEPPSPSNDLAEQVLRGLLDGDATNLLIDSKGRIRKI